MSSNKVEQFMDSPLMAWAKTFDDYNMVQSIDDLADGVLLHKIMHTVDPNAYSMSKVNLSVGHDPALRMQNLQLLVVRFKHFYLTYLQQLVISTLPNVSAICHSPDSDYSLDEMERLLVLLLGCVVQCDGKVPLIERMKAMDLTQQQALVSHIQQMTDTTEYVCSIDWNDLEEISKPNLEGLCRTAYIHLQRVAKERDHHYDTLLEVVLERDYYKQVHQSQGGDDSLPHENGLSITSTPAKSPVFNAEVMELKKKCRELQEQLDRKLEMVTDLKEDLEQSRNTIHQLRQEKRELAESARSVRVYRDEIETLKVQSSRVEKLEADVMKYRQKAEDTEYLKKRIAELKQQNDLMLETKALLEQKAISLTARAESVDELQEEMASIKVQLESLNQEKEMDSERIEDLLAQNAQLELDARHYKEQIADLKLEVEKEKLSASEVSSSGEASNLSFEMSEADLAAKAKVLRLEKEAREMEKSMDTLRQTQAKCSELEKTNKKLYSQTHTDRKEIIKLREEVEVLKVKASRVDKLQVELSSQRERLEEASRLTAKLKELKSRNEVILETKARLEDEVESLQSKATMMEDLKDEGASLKAQVESLNSEHEEDQRRVQELLEQNAQLELEMQRCSEEKAVVLATLEQERSSGGQHGPLTVLSPPRITEEEMASRAKLQRLEKRLREMEKAKDELRHTQAKCSELERMNKKLQEHTHSDRKEIIRLKEELQGFKTKSERLERLQLEIQNQEHKLEDTDSVKRKLAELKEQNALLSETKVLLQEEVNSLHNKLEKLCDVQAENAALQVRVDTMEQDLQEESVRMQELLEQNVQLELDRDRRNAELESLHNEIAQLKLKRVPEPREDDRSRTEQDFATQTKLLHLERENRELDRSVHVLKQSRERTLAEMEKMNKKLTAQIHADKKEIARLKEELRRERNQHATLTRLKSVGDEHDLQHTKQFQELESKFQETFSQSLTTKDERIQVLECRVEEITEDNTQLREELKALKKLNERLKEMTQSTTGGGGSPMGSPSLSRNLSQREINRLKEQASDALRLRERMHRLEQENHHLAGDLVDARHIIQRHESTNHRLGDRIQMLEQLAQTLEEEKRTLMLQINKLLENNQDMLVKTLESKDQVIEEERTFNDRLGELERDKARLSQQLIAQQREHLAREMDFYKKSKSKNLLKRGFKKLKGKIQQGRTHTFELSDTGGSSLALPLSQQSLTASMGSPSSQGLSLGLPPYAYHDGSMSSSQSISSSNSGRHSDNGLEEDLEQPENAMGTSSGYSLIPRAPTLESTTFLRPRRSRSYTLPSGPKPRRLHVASSPNFEADITDELMSLEDFLAESEKTPNRRRVMELKRASLILNTPPVTPRNSLLITHSANSAANTSDNTTLDVQEFLSQCESEELQKTIPEVEESDLEPQLSATEFQTSLASHRSTSSIHSNTRSQSGEPTLELNMDTNASSNNNVDNFSGSVTVCDRDGPASSTPNSDTTTTVSWGNTSRISVSSAEPSGALSSTEKSQLRPRVQSVGDTRSYSTLLVPLKGEDGATKKSKKGLTKSRSTDKLKQEPKGKEKGKGRVLQRRFHKSTEALDAEVKRVTGKPPLVKRKIHKSSADLVDHRKKQQHEEATIRSYAHSDVGGTSKLSGLTDLNHKGERQLPNGKKTRNAKRLSLPSWGFSPKTRSSPAPLPHQKQAPLHESLHSPKSDEDSVWFEYGCV